MDSNVSGTWDIRGKTVLVTGGNSGIGKATVVELARRGARVVFTSRDVARGEAALAEIHAAVGKQHADAVEVRQLDLASFRSIEAFAAELLSDLTALHVLVHNAGIIQPERAETEDGFELTFGTNHLGGFLLNERLLPLLKESAPARIVVVASSAHTRPRHGLDFGDLQSLHDYDSVGVYAESKLANVLFTRELARRLAGTGVTANCLHPGVVASNFNRGGGTGGLWGVVFTWLRPLLLSPAKGARTTVHVCCDPELAGVSGAYFSGSREATPSRAALDDDAGLKLWELSEALCVEASAPNGPLR